MKLRLVLSLHAPSGREECRALRVSTKSPSPLMGLKLNDNEAYDGFMTSPLIPVCVVADDLTGALDSAVDFLSQTESVQVIFAPGGALPRRGLVDHSDAQTGIAIATGTRELTPAQAADAVMPTISALSRAELAFKKIDSLLRGPWAAEIAACWQSGHWDSCIIAPAFPELGRITRGGAQFMMGPDGAWQNVCSDIVAELAHYGLQAVLVDAPPQNAQGLWVVNAVAQGDLERLASWRERGDKILWCGSGGLSSALAGQAWPAHPYLKAPILGLFGSDHPVTKAQIEACHSIHQRVDPKQSLDAQALSHKMAHSGAAFVSLILEEGMRRDDAALKIAEAFAQLIHSIDKPASLIVAGGETLQSLFPILQIESLKLIGKIAAGVPRSVIMGGPWAGVELISKSGAFGVKTLWSELLLRNNLPRNEA